MDTSDLVRSDLVLNDLVRVCDFVQLCVLMRNVNLNNYL